MTFLEAIKVIAEHCKKGCDYTCPYLDEISDECTLINHVLEHEDLGDWDKVEGGRTE